MTTNSVLRSIITGSLTVSALLAIAPEVEAAGRKLVAEPVEGVKIRIDGDLREWPAKMTPLSENASGSALEARAVVGYDEQNVYLALRASDARIARTAGAGKNEDHATLTLAFPRGREYVTYEIDVYPGKPGRLPAAVKLEGKPIAGAKAVENPTEKELLLEALIPWATFPEAASTRVGLRASVAYANADAPGALKGVVSTAEGTRGRALGSLVLEAEQALSSLLEEKGLSDVPAREAYGNLTGDGMLERVAVFGQFLTISGPRFRGGKEFYFAEVGVSGPDMIHKLDLVDLDRDGRAEVVLRKRIGTREKYREILEVLKVGKGDAPYSAFSHEVGIKTPEGLISNKVALQGGIIEIAQGKAEGFEPESYAEELPGNMPSALLPWESVGSRRFKWQGSAFEKVDEQAWEPKGGARGPTSKGSQRKRSSSPSRGTAVAAPPPPRPPTSDELLDRVYALYKRERGVSGGRPRFDFVTDVAGDTGPERVLVHDKDIVVFGKGFRGGTSFAFISVGVADPKDILDATARDVNGDGKAEIILRAVMRAKASKALGGDTVDRHALLVYAIEEEGLVRIFGAETGRALGKNQILGSVAFTSGPRGVSIELRPGRAIGWTAEDYPFPPDTTTAGGLEPLLLPWAEGKRSYRYDGNSFALD